MPSRLAPVTGPMIANGLLLCLLYLKNLIHLLFALRGICRSRLRHTANFGFLRLRKDFDGLRGRCVVRRGLWAFRMRCLRNQAVQHCRAIGRRQKSIYWIIKHVMRTIVS